MMLTGPLPTDTVLLKVKVAVVVLTTLMIPLVKAGVAAIFVSIDPDPIYNWLPLVVVTGNETVRTVDREAVVAVNRTPILTWIIFPILVNVALSSVLLVMFVVFVKVGVYVE